jgi:hypothetical protein
MVSRERRSYVREKFSFMVRYAVISPEEYKELEMQSDRSFSPKTISVDIDRKDVAISEYYFIANFLLQMDEKLNQIVNLLSKDGNGSVSLNQGLGVNISGSGMNILTDSSVKKGAIIRMEFVLSRLPLIFINAFGKVIQASRVDENGKNMYSLGVEFLDLDSDYREKIISCVFKKHREAIRNRSNLHDTRNMPNA